MKKCEYCSKEISYHEQYCSENCEIEAKKFYTYRNSRSGLFTALSITFMICTAVGGFMYLFGLSWATCIMTFSLMCLGVTIILFPYGTEEMIKKHGIKHCAELIKKIGIVVAVVGFVCFVISLLYNFL